MEGRGLNGETTMEAPNVEPLDTTRRGLYDLYEYGFKVCRVYDLRASDLWQTLNPEP